MNIATVLLALECCDQYQKGGRNCDKCPYDDPLLRGVYCMDYMHRWAREIIQALPKNCDTCRHCLGGGCCRINLEAECGKGEFEAWEPKEGSKDHETYTPADHGGKGAAAPGHD